jgi:small conductance mechanosensitive channel
MPQVLPKGTPIKTDSIFTPLNRSYDLHKTLSDFGTEETWLRAGSFAQMMMLKIIYALVILVLFWLIARTLNAILHRVFARTSAKKGVQQLVLKSVKLAVLTFGIIMALGEFVNITPMLAGIGVVGIAVGFAAQDTIQNFISGITILIDQPFKVGDNISVDSTFGTVHEITLRSTRILTMNHEIVVLPNNQMINQKLINHTSMHSLRIEFPFSIGYAESVKEARKVVLESIQKDQRILRDPSPSVIVKSLADSAVILSLRIWLANPKDEMPVRDQCMERIQNALNHANTLTY